MNDYIDIDLRNIIKNIIKKWYWIAISAFLIGVVAFLISYLQPDVYRATARFVITQPPYVANFDNRYATNVLDNPSPDVLLNIINNDTIIAALFDLWESPDKSNSSPKQFKQGHLEAVIGEEGISVFLHVDTENRENAAEIANEWGRLAMAAVDSSLYGYESNQITFFEVEAELAKADLEQAGQALIDFEEENPLAILTNNLNDQLAYQMEINQFIRTIGTVQEDIRSLLAQLEIEDQESSVHSSLRLDFLLIQAKLFSNPMMIGNSPSFHSTNSSIPQLVVDLTGLEETIMVADFQGMLESWLDTLDERIVNLENLKGSLEDEITSLQGEIQAIKNESDILQAEYDRQESVYNILSTKLEEVYLTMPEGESGYVNLVSPAYVPDPADVIPHNTVRNTAIALIAGGFLGVVGVVIADWWKSSDESNEQVEE